MWMSALQAEPRDMEDNQVLKDINFRANLIIAFDFGAFSVCLFFKLSPDVLSIFLRGKEI